jgi:hypothetical protein
MYAIHFSSLGLTALWPRDEVCMANMVMLLFDLSGQNVPEKETTTGIE